jgi:signal transduction histidine kinase/ligand-binding sensor domain-containing protein/CheY-like chemotaxis protein
MSSRMRHFPLLVVSGVLFWSAAGVARAAEAPPLVVAHLSSLEGLPQGTVMATLQDSQGFVWLGTEDGLVRFDGHDIHRYAYTQSLKNGLPGNFVNAIVEDSLGDLWIGMKGAGVAHWSRSTDTFTSYRHEIANPESLSSDSVRSLLVDPSGRLWIGTLNAGVDVFEPKTGRFNHLRHGDDAAVSLIDDAVLTFMRDPRGRVWIGTKKGIDRWEFDGRAFHHVQSIDAGQGALGDKRVTQLVPDRNGGIWVGTEDAGLYLIDSAERVVASFVHDVNSSSSIANNEIRAVLQDGAGNLWIGTADGLDLFDSKTREFRHYVHDKADRDSLNDSTIMSLYEDKSGLLWIGTKAGGVDRFNPHSWELGGNRPSWLNGKLVTAFADAANGDIWVSSRGGGLVRIDTLTGEASPIDKILKPPNALADRRVMSLRLDAHGTLWIGTMTDGLKSLSADGHLKSIPTALGDPHSLSAPGIMTIFESRSGLLWIGTHGGGANVLDTATGIVRQLPYGANIANAVSSENVTSFAEDAHGNMWIGTENGLNLATSEGAVKRVFHHDPDNAASLPADVVYSLAIDANDQVWVATNGGGLSKVEGSSLDPSAIQFKSIGGSDGLSNATVYGVLTDKLGGLWMSGNTGLMRYDVSTHEVRTYHREDGLQGEEFNFGASYKTRDGRLCFGGTEGYNIFRPEILSPRRNAPRVVLTQMEILGVPADGATPFWLLHQVSLDYRASIVSIGFAALDFASPNRNRFEYRIAGLSDAWINLDMQRRLTLTNLESGDYLLEVRAANADSVWSSAPLRLAIHKDAAPWKSRTAYAVYVVVTVGGLLLGFWFQRKKWRQASSAKLMLESQVAERTQELQETNQRLLVASEAKSNFLARMSHELRTPMNGVVGMTELLERTSLTAIQARQTQTIKASAQTLLQILNDLLDLSKVQAGKIELECLPFDLTHLSEECASLFAGTAESKGLEVIVCPPIRGDVQLKGDPLRIRQVLMNLIANAVKFTETGEIVINCEIVADQPNLAMVHIAVSDTGIGLRPEAIAKIFDPFTQADETTTRRFGGSGLGLSICAELVKLMGGTIGVNSEPGVGSTFTVSLPLQTMPASDQVQPPLLRGRRVRIISRRGSLTESLRRYLAQLTPLSITAGGPPTESLGDPSELTVWDADSCGAALHSFCALNELTRAQIVVVATALAVEEHGLEQFIPIERIVTKPVFGDALRAALGGSSEPGMSSRGSRGAAPHTASSLNLHVLIVEDEAVNAEVAKGYLTELGCTSVWVQDGTAAIARNAIERFDLILMDLNMPGLDGFATAQFIREREQPQSAVPIVALTATEVSDCRERCLLAGMDAVLGKPYTYAQFADILNGMTRGARPTAGKVATEMPRHLVLHVDRSVIDALRTIGRGDQRDLFNHLIGIFRRSSTLALQEIGRSLSAHDYEAVRSTCHKMKSGAANVGALGFADLMEELERACADRDGERACGLHKLLLVNHAPLLQLLERTRVEESA